MDYDEDCHQRIESLEVDRQCLLQEIKELKKALDKQKTFHRKFVADVPEAEEMRIQDFNQEMKELREENKRLKAENRELAKEKSFYQTAYAYDSFTTDDMGSHRRSSNTNQSMERPISHIYDTKHSSTDVCGTPSSSIHFHINEVPVHSSSVREKKSNQSLKKVAKLSEKWFEDYKKVKHKAEKLSTINVQLKLKVKQLENFKDKIQNKKIQQEAHRNELQSLCKSTVRANGQIFSSEALKKLGRLSKD